MSTFESPLHLIAWFICLKYAFMFKICAVYWLAKRNDSWVTPVIIL